MQIEDYLLVAIAFAGAMLPLIVAFTLPNIGKESTDNHKKKHAH